MSPKTFSTFVLFVLLLLLIMPADMLAQTPNQAALVVRFSDGSTHSQCIEFSESQISGYELLARSGLSLEVDTGSGLSVCSINGTGCPASNCFCQCTGGDECVYWSYWHFSGGTWQYSNIGASLYQVGDGVVEGWSWGAGSPSNAISPPVVSFEDVCGSAATATPLPTNTPVPPTATPIPPTNTPLPTATPVTPTATPVPEIDFWADALNIAFNSCTTLHWDVENITAVYLDGDGVLGEGAKEVCPTQTQTYTLRIEHSGGEKTKTLTISVSENPPTVIATSLPTDTPLVVNTAVSITAAQSSTPTSTLEPTLPTAVPITETSPPAAPEQIAAEPTIIWVTVPPALQPTETMVPATAVAAVPAESVSGEAKMAVGEETAVSVLPYVAFGFIVLALAALLLLAKLKTGR